MKSNEAISTYRILTATKTEKTDALRISNLETEDIFRVLRAANALKPIATAYDDFLKDARERLKPDGWDKRVEQYNDPDTSEEEKQAIIAEAEAYERRVLECCQSELEKECTPSAYERLGKDALARLIKDNESLIDVPTAMLLQDVIGEEK